MTLKHILVTGAGGFLGSEIIKKAIGDGFFISATDRVGRIYFPGVNFVVADILKPDSFLSLFNGVHCVCHVAGLAHIFKDSEIFDRAFYDVNVIGTKNVAQAARGAGVRHFIFVSSVSVYGGKSHGKDENSECRPETPYGKSKWEAEQWLIDFCQRVGINLTILRFATLYGEGDPGNVARLIRTIDRGCFFWVGKGDNLKSLIHKEDAARACIKVLKNPRPGINIYNVSAPPYKMKDIVEAISLALGKSIPSLYIPASCALKSAKVLKIILFNHKKANNIYDTLKKWLANDYYDINKFKKAYNFETAISLEEGIEREVRWLKSNSNHNR